MISLRHILLPSACIVFAFSACLKDETQTNETPSLSIESVSKTELTEFKDSLIVTIRYEDGDGDLGQVNPDSNYLLIRDARLTKADYYHIKPLNPKGDDEIKMSGTLNVKLYTLFILGSNDNEKTTLSFRIKDRAGHWSNTVNTPILTISR